MTIEADDDDVADQDGDGKDDTDDEDGEELDDEDGEDETDHDDDDDDEKADVVPVAHRFISTAAELNTRWFCR